MPDSALPPLQLAAAALRPALTVAGHESAAGAPLSAASGLFLKPLPDGDARAARELAFYSRFSASALRPFLPAFMGVACLPAAAPAPPRRFLALQDQCAALRRPCLADVKARPLVTPLAQLTPRSWASAPATRRCAARPTPPSARPRTKAAPALR